MASLADRQHDADNIGRSIKTPQELWEAYEVLADLERALIAAGARLHEQGHSWGALAAPFGITRQGARKRWGLAATSAVDPTLDDIRDDPDIAATSTGGRYGCDAHPDGHTTDQGAAACVSDGVM